jgi:hypothetical protein
MMTDTDAATLQTRLEAIVKEAKEAEEKAAVVRRRAQDT